MAVPAPAHPFLLRLTDGRSWGAAEFPNGFVCVHTPGGVNICTIAVTLTDLLDVPEGNPLHGAKVEEYGGGDHGKPLRRLQQPAGATVAGAQTQGDDEAGHPDDDGGHPQNDGQASG